MIQLQKQVNKAKATLNDILKDSFEGNYILKLAHEKKPISDANRAILINLIVNYFIQNYFKMGVRHCEIITKQIVEYFPTEAEVRFFTKSRMFRLFNISFTILQAVYFHRRKNQKPKGQLYDKYNNYTAKLRSNDFLPKPVRYNNNNSSEGKPKLYFKNILIFV